MQQTTFWFFFFVCVYVFQKTQISCEQLSYFPLRLWAIVLAIVLWATVLWAIVLWANVCAPFSPLRLLRHSYLVIRRNGHSTNICRQSDLSTNCLSTKCRAPVHTYATDQRFQTTCILYTVYSLITKTCLYNFDPIKPHFYIAKLGLKEVYTIFLISAKKHRLWVLVRTASARRF